jgi:hypothetical protein
VRVVRFLALTFLSERQGQQHVVEVENIIQLVDYGCGVDEKPSLNTRDALLTLILDAAARIKECRDQVKQTTCDIYKRAAKCS